jgi:hypothetical protein
MNQGVISRHAWVHGQVRCPNCDLPIDRIRDHGDYLWDDSGARSYGVQGKHERCGAAFRFDFDDVRNSSHRDPGLR